MRVLKLDAVLVLLAFIVAEPLLADTVQQMLGAKKLQTDFNPVLVTYLLEEGKNALPSAQQKEALDQQVSSFRQEINVRPSGTAAAAVASLAGVFMHGEAGHVMRDAAEGVWTSWVDSADVLLRAGYTKDVTPFYRNCIENFPYDDLRARCVVGLARAEPDGALTFLTSLLSNDHPIEVSNAALRMLGLLAADESYPRAQRDVAIDQLSKYTEGMMNSTHFAAAADGLVSANDKRAIESLRKLTKGFKGEEEKHIALRGLAVVYHDQEALDTLKKSLKGGLMSNANDQLFAGTALIEAGDPAGYDWASSQLAPSKKGFLARAVSLDEKHDNSTQILRALVERGDENARTVLNKALEAGVSHPAVYIVALYQIGDNSRADETKNIAMNADHAANLRARAALLIAKKTNDMSVIPALDSLAHDRNTQVNDRITIAGILGEIDSQEAAALASSMLDDREASVRTAAAYSLMRMKNAAALRGLSKVMTTKFGTKEDAQVQASAVRAAALNFRGSSTALLASAATSSFPSVQFLATAEQQQSASSDTAKKKKKS